MKKIYIILLALIFASCQDETKYKEENYLRIKLVNSSSLIILNDVENIDAYKAGDTISVFKASTKWAINNIRPETGDIQVGYNTILVRLATIQP